MKRLSTLFSKAVEKLSTNNNSSNDNNNQNNDGDNTGEGHPVTNEEMETEDDILVDNSDVNPMNRDGMPEINSPLPDNNNNSPKMTPEEIEHMMQLVQEARRFNEDSVYSRVPIPIYEQVSELSMNREFC